MRCTNSQQTKQKARCLSPPSMEERGSGLFLILDISVCPPTLCGCVCAGNSFYQKDVEAAAAAGAGALADAVPFITVGSACIGICMYVCMCVCMCVACTGVYV